MIPTMKNELTPDRTNAEPEINSFLRVAWHPLRLCVSSPLATLLLCALALIPAAGRAATNELTALLQQGLFEEQANRNLDAAIENYQSLATQFDQDRQLAATAVFRLGECYRAQGRTNEAAAQYQRILRDFADQTTLATLSRQNLTGMGFANQELFQQRLQAVVAKAPSDATALPADGEGQEIQRIEQMIQNSPDLINAPEPMSALGTPLVKVAYYGWLKAAAFLLDHDAAVNGVATDVAQTSELRNFGKITPLVAAVAAGNKAMTQFLIEHGANVNFKGENNGVTPLHLAAQKGFQAVTEVLLASHAGVNVGNVDGATPLCSAVQSGQLKIVQMLLAAGAKVDFKDGKGRTVLNYAIGISPEIFQALLDAGTDPNTEDSEGRTPLSYAVERDSSQVVKLLLAAKADPNGGRKDDPLLAAVAKNNSAVAEMLLQGGANPNAIGSAFFSETGRGASIWNQRSHLTPLWLAVYLNEPLMAQLLLKYKADPNDSQTDGRPVSFNAVSNSAVLEALLDAGAKADEHDRIVAYNNVNMDQPLLSAAVAVKNTASVEVLLKHGANPNTPNGIGYTPLHVAAAYLVDRKIFELLLAQKADPNVRNHDGQTPLDLLKGFVRQNAFANGMSAPGPDVSPEKIKLAGELADLLRQHGALDNLPNWDCVAVSRPAANFTQTVFQKSTNGWNQFTLLETLLNFYESQISAQPTGTSFAGRLARATGVYPGNIKFPDLAQITIVRPGRDSTKGMRIKVNLLNHTNGIDCLKDMPLEFGDIVEIPERDHALGDKAVGLDYVQNEIIGNYLKGNVQLVAHGQKVELPIYPSADGSLIGSVIQRAEAQKVLLSSSDLSRVKIIRRDPKTGKKQEWILDCRSAVDSRNSNSAPDLWLRDGDVIEVPEKQ